jgi:hypothetical protein
VSIEAVGLMQNYTRRGSNWFHIEKNIDRFLEYTKTSTDNLGVEVHTTVQALNIAHYSSLKKWCNDRTIKNTITILETPAYLGMSVVPNTIKNQAIVSLNELELDTDAQALLLLLKEISYDPILAEKFIRFIKWYDPELELLEVDNSWQELF